jgi:hypothetical protein
MSSTAAGVGDPWRVFQFVHDWAERPYFRGAGEAEHGAGHFQGRGDELKQLTQFFVEGSGGTALVSGFRGVGKTATVDRALIEALAAIKQENGPGTEGTDRTSRRENFLRRRQDSSDLTEAILAQLRPKRLIALKLDFGQIATLKPAGAAPLSGQSTPAQNGNAQATEPNPRSTEVDPRQVLIEIIKGLHRNLVDDRRFDAEEKRALGQMARLQAMADLANK